MLNELKLGEKALEILLDQPKAWMAAAETNGELMSISAWRGFEANYHIILQVITGSKEELKPVRFQEAGGPYIFRVVKGLCRVSTGLDLKNLKTSIKEECQITEAILSAGSIYKSTDP